MKANNCQYDKSTGFCLLNKYKNMLDWFYDTPIVRAIMGIEKNPVIKKKWNFQKVEQLKRNRARFARKRKNKFLKR